MGPLFNPPKLSHLALGHLAVQQPKKLLELPRRWMIDVLSFEVEGVEGEDQPMKGCQIPERIPIRLLIFRFALLMSVPKYPTNLEELLVTLIALSKARDSVRDWYRTRECLTSCPCLVYTLEDYIRLKTSLMKRGTLRFSDEYIICHFRTTFESLIDCIHQRRHRASWS